MLIQNMQEEAVKLGKAGYVAFSVNLQWDSINNKKELKFPFAGWQKADVATDQNHPWVSDSFNGLALVTGKASDVLAIDADRLKPGEDDVIDGLDHIEKLITQRGMPEGVVIAETGSGGRHYLFSYSKSLQAGLQDPSKCVLKKIKKNLGCTCGEIGFNLLFR